MANSLQINQSAPVAGLGTSTYTVVNAGEITVSCQSTLPASSQLQIVINQNGTPLLTIGGATANPTPTQPSIGSSVRLYANAADVITVVLSSSAAADNALNAVKSIINLYSGE